MWHRKMRHNLAQVENAGHENAGPCRQDGKCETRNARTGEHGKSRMHK